jgi:hypothetical protein
MTADDNLIYPRFMPMQQFNENNDKLPKWLMFAGDGDLSRRIVGRNIAFRSIYRLAMMRLVDKITRHKR